MLTTPYGLRSAVFYFSIRTSPLSPMRLYLQLFLLALSPVVALKVTVLGGSGFVGSRCCKALVEKGVSVTSVSTSGAAPDWCAGQEWAQSVEWRKNELTRGSRESIVEAEG